MILINDEKRGRFIDVKILQRQLTEHINDCREDIDSCQKDNAAELLDDIAAARNTLRALSEMQKVPFDALIVIEKEK